MAALVDIGDVGKKFRQLLTSRDKRILAATEREIGFALKYIMLKRRVKSLRRRIAMKIWILIVLAIGSFLPSPVLATVSPVGTWDIDFQGDVVGHGYITFEGDFTLNGYIIIGGIKTKAGVIANNVGFFSLTGAWSQAGAGRIIGVMHGDSDVICGAEDVVFEVFSFVGIVTAGAQAKLSLHMHTNNLPDGNVFVHGVPDTGNVPDFTGTWDATGLTGANQGRFIETYDFSLSVLSFTNLYDLTGFGFGYTVHGCVLANGKNRLALTVVNDDDSTERILIGTFSPKANSAKLGGFDSGKNLSRMILK